MPARTAAADAEFVRVHMPGRRIVADEPHGAVHVLGDLGNGELRLAGMTHGEDGVTAVEKWREVLGAGPVVARPPCAAHHVDDTVAVGGLRLHHVESEGEAELAAV